jgi:hypothetical protein
MIIVVDQDHQSVDSSDLINTLSNVESMSITDRFFLGDVLNRLGHHGIFNG